VLLGKPEVQLAGGAGELLDALDLIHLVVLLELLLEVVEVLQRQELLDRPTVLVLGTQQQIVDEAL
jgi:hypothetical protein